MGNKTAIIIEPCKIGSSEHHHLLSTRKTYDYVRKEWSDRNESWCEVTGLEQYFEILKEQYRQATKGQSPQLKEKVRIDKKTGKKKVIQGWSPIREGVVVISDKTTMEDCKRLAESLRLTFGIKTIQIHIDRDEGHYDDKQKWKPNLHAHFVFDWTDGNGKTIKLNDKQISYMQDVCAYNLRMERGDRTGRKYHVESLEFKVREKEKQVKEKTREWSYWKSVSDKEEKDSQRLKAENERLKTENESLKEDNQAMKNELQVAEEKRANIYSERDNAIKDWERAESEKKTLKAEITNLKGEKSDLDLMIIGCETEIASKSVKLGAIKRDLERKKEELREVYQNTIDNNPVHVKAENEAMVKKLARLTESCEWAKELKSTFREVSNRTLARMMSGLTSVVSGIFRHDNESIEVKNVELKCHKGENGAEQVIARDYGSNDYYHLSAYVQDKIKLSKAEEIQEKKRTLVKKKSRGMGV